VGTAIPSVFLQIDENPNCASLDGLVFQPRSVPKALAQVRCARNGTEDWYEVAGLEADAEVCPAMACLIDDSGDGACYLVFGGGWGLRFRPVQSADAWDIESPAQWGEPYLLLPADGSDLRFR
jgi:hypothetical protein